MIVGNKRYCDECNSDNAQRYYVGPIIRDYCLDCAIKYNVVFSSTAVIMNEEELRKLMQSGFEKLKPYIEGMTVAMMECYQQGFKDCWKVLTGKEF